MYKDEKRVSTVILMQSNMDELELRENMPIVDTFPIVKLHIQEKSVQSWHKSSTIKYRQFDVRFLKLCAYIERAFSTCSTSKRWPPST